MSDVSTSKSKSKTSSEIELPKFEIPRFEMPKFEVPSAFREFAEKSVSQCKDNWEKMKAATEEATGVIEDSYATASRGFTDYGLKVIEAARANTNSNFDYAGKLFTVKSVSEAIELSTAHLRGQYEAFSAQAKELSALAQKVATETTVPLKETMSSAFKKAA